MKSFEVMALSQTAKTCEEGDYKVSQIERYTAYDTNTGMPVEAYIAKVGDVWYKVPPVGCRTITTCADDLFEQLTEHGSVTMTVKFVKGRKRDYKMVTFTS